MHHLASPRIVMHDGMPPRVDLDRVVLPPLKVLAVVCLRPT